MSLNAGSRVSQSTQGFLSNMWCTRWYLPLILLPLPTAPPFFLALFLLSLTLHARPCFYCIVLLTALFLSSCYWPPIPIETSLTTAWSENITTYADALLSLMPDLSRESLPSDIPIVEHCWCDFTTGTFFEPFDVTRWEVESVIRLKEELEVQQQLQAGLDGTQAAAQEGEDKDEVGDLQTTRNATTVPSYNASPFAFRWSSMLAPMWPFVQGPDRPSSQVSASSAVMPESAGPIATQTPCPSLPTSSQMVLSTTRLPWLRREYDLRPFGFDMTVDFGWSRS